jgi:hypothetical protein
MREFLGDGFDLAFDDFEHIRQFRRELRGNPELIAVATGLVSPPHRKPDETG